MATEIERKFLVDVSRMGPLVDGIEMLQGYIPTRDRTAVRVRLAGNEAWLTLKGESRGAARSEFEYPVPPEDARRMIEEFCAGKVISKTRHRVEFEGYVWEVDIFAGDNAGLVLAEVELSREDECPPLPPWAGREVTADSRYFNSALYENPFCEWGDARQAGEDGSL